MRRMFRRYRNRIMVKAFTLIELLIVLFIMSVLAAIALPTAKGLIEDQKGSRAARSIIAFFDVARSRAIAEGRYVGVRIERLDTATAFGQAASVQLRQLTGVPPYSGDASNAYATLKGSPINQAEFIAADCPLLLLSSQIINGVGPAVAPPIQIGDLLELPGGRMVPISGMAGVSPTASVVLTLQMKQSVLGGANTFPTATRGALNSAGDRVKFRIHRSPVPSSSNTLALPRGTAIDLNYSGVGITGNQFNPVSTTSDIDIIFGPSGSVFAAGGSTPLSMIYLCLGESDGVIPAGEDLYQQDRQGTANLMNLDSVWLMINPNSGKITASPIASVRSASIPTDVADRTDLSYLSDVDPVDIANNDSALADARSLAVQSVQIE
ncbi:hypothetical protein Q31b_06990 [Novipirellula aureliae]|uniref:Uncharacterized protein n=1 Tax=Novipirellula aureliae TaxID=2527966 RepID=A0A5C6EAI1_9BACT|nr:prepilin-type N-terminal cleavage/methylation domain-containing protein [Novipirellula aureliae]TWU45525.1 hypothetical protein Q31b_06990 [Novipirellula aureliae]